MKAEWTKAGGGAVTLGDDSVKHTMVLEQLGGECQEQVDPLFRATYVARRARGNVAGNCAFTAAKSHASREAAMAVMVAEYARMGEKGSLALTFGAAGVMTLANAVLKGVELADTNGLRWTIRYRFGITTMTTV